MGCDIHARIEHKRYHHTGRFDLFLSVWIPRNYALFARMAGVRNPFNVEAVAPIRGFPDDADIETQTDYESNGDRHTPSWLATEEFERAVILSNQDGGIERGGIEAQAYIAAMRVMESFGYPCRIVFWFDS